MDSSKIKGNVNGDAPVKSTRIRVGRSIEGFGLSPGITKEQRLEVIISKYELPIYGGIKSCSRDVFTKKK